MAFHDYEFKVKFTGRGIKLGYFKEYERPLKPSDLLWLIPVIIICVLLFVFVLIPGFESETEVRDAFNAFKIGNNEIWAEYVHPDYYEELGDLDALKESMGRNALAINSASTVKEVDTSPPLISGEPYTLTADVLSGGNKYRVEMEYLSGEEKSGIISVEVSFIYLPYGTPSPRFEPPVRTPAQ